MIKIRDQVPQVYTNASRDFQYLGWLYDIVLNSVKHNIDDLYMLPNNQIDPKITEILALTLGFKVKRNYDQRQLAALVSIFPRILRKKGSEEAIKMAGDALLKAAGVSGSFICSLDEEDGASLNVTIPAELRDISLFVDLLPYILPAGMTCKIGRKTVTSLTGDNYRTKIKPRSVLTAKWQTDNKLAQLYDTGKDKPVYANYDDNNLNTGLMENTLIPVLDPNLTNQQSEE